MTMTHDYMQIPKHCHSAYLFNVTCLKA